MAKTTVLSGFAYRESLIVDDLRSKSLHDSIEKKKNHFPSMEKSQLDVVDHSV